MDRRLHLLAFVNLIGLRDIAASAFLFCSLAVANEPVALDFSAPPLVASVAILGTNLPVKLATQVGQLYTAKVIEKDVHYLWSTGLFDDIRVETTQQGEGTAVVFHVLPSPDLRLHDIRIDPSSYGLRLMVPEGTPINRMRAHEIAVETRKQLNAQGYTDAQVDSELVPLAGNQVTLRLTVKASDPVRVKGVEFVGDFGIGEEELRGAFRALRTRRVIPRIPGVWEGWRLYPAYSQGAVDSDLSRLLSLYLSKGYFDARVRVNDIGIHHANARISVLAQAGPLYRVPEWTVPSARALCSSLFAERREAEREGILDFNVRLAVHRIGGGSDPNPVAGVNTKIDRGRAYRVGQINLMGSRHYKDATIRRNFLLAEGGVFDERLLRKSLARLNRAKLFEQIDDRNVVIRPNENTGEADVSVRLIERTRGSWSISGPVGPVSIGGPLQASIGSRLPAWGAGLLELSTYTASVSLMGFTHPILPLLAITSKTSGVLPVLALQRPFSPGGGWKSGFVIGPQLGWQIPAVAYAATQIRERVLPLLAGDRGLVPDLPVMVEAPAGEGVMYCEPPNPRLWQLRNSAAFSLRLLGGLAGL